MTTATDTADATRPTADELNAHLAGGGCVVVATHLRHTHYLPKHAGVFEDRRGTLYVRRGRGADCLSIGNRLLVGIRLR